MMCVKFCPTHPIPTASIAMVSVSEEIIIIIIYLFLKQLGFIPVSKNN